MQSRLARGAWIETGLSRYNLTALLSRLAGDAWIETTMWQGVLFPLPSRLAGAAWIEIGYRGGDQSFGRDITLALTFF